MALFRFLLRLAASVLLAVAVIAAVVDATLSVAADRIVLTPLSDSWAALSATSLAGARDAVAAAEFLLLDQALELVLSLPTAAVLAVVALVLYALGRRPRRRIGRFAVGH